MCGIAGYVGINSSKDFLIEGLKKLEYRGYDSAGIATLENGVIKVTKTKGSVDKLANKTEIANHIGSTGIGHTRWATHGKPDEVNSHPHISQNGKFAIVHNGIIENYLKLKEMLEKAGFEFKSETDTEVIPNLVQYFYSGDVFDAFVKTVSILKGSYALGLVSSYETDKIYATSKESPLIIGIGEKENYIASDVQAFLSRTREVCFMKEGEFATVSKDGVTITDSNKNKIHKEVIHINQSETIIEKNGYEFFMFKEIMEQPEVVADTIERRINNGFVDLSEIKLTKSYFKEINRIIIVGCGSAYHAGMFGKNIIEDMARVHVQVELASEFKYNNPIVGKGDFVIVISQSGETSDTLAALKLAKEKGAETLSIVNVKGSSIARASENVIYTQAGTEIAVATTKAYTAQIVVMCLLAVYIADAKNLISQETYCEFVKNLIKLPGDIRSILKDHKMICELSKNFLSAKNVFFIGRGLDYSIAMEGALKLKEISYIHSESYAAGELKHGTISLIEDGTLVFALCAVKELYEKMIGNIKEVKARGATVVAIKISDYAELGGVADYVINIPDINKYFSGILEIIYLQLFAYYVSYNKGLDVDKPRNLAKSVTVE